MEASLDITRRNLLAGLGSAAAAAAIGKLQAQGANDPLGVRPDFPILENGRTYLNSASITPCPREVAAAGAAFVQAKATRPITVGEMLAKAGEVRAQFARLVNATPEEIGFVFATTEGENIVANTVPLNPGDNVVVYNIQ